MNPTPTQRIKGLYLRNQIWWFARQHRGKRTFISLETDDYAEAVCRAARFLATPELNTTSGLLGDIEAFFAFKASHDYYSPSSLRKKRIALNAFATWAGHPATRTITERMARDYYTHLKATVKPITARGYFYVLRAFFTWAKTARIVALKPTDSVHLERISQPARLRFCTAAQRDLLIASAPTDDLRFALFAGFHSGLRFGEITEAVPEWFDLATGVVNISETKTFRTKNRRGRTIPLTAAFRAFLAKFGLRSPFMAFPDRRHHGASYRYDWSRSFKDHAAKCGLPWVTPHVMRHTFASLLASRGCSIYKIAVWLGDNLDTVQRHYAQLLPADNDIEMLTASPPAQEAHPPQCAPPPS